MVLEKIRKYLKLNNTHLKRKIRRENRRYFEPYNNGKIKNKTTKSEEKDGMRKCMAQLKLGAVVR